MLKIITIKKEICDINLLLSLGWQVYEKEF